MVKQRQMCVFIVVVLLAGCGEPSNNFIPVSGYGDAANITVDSSIGSAAGYNGAIAGSIGVEPVGGSTSIPDSSTNPDSTIIPVVRDAATLTPDTGISTPIDAGGQRDGGTVDVVPQDAGSEAGSAVADAGPPTPPSNGSVDISSCTPPPAGSSDMAVQAWTLVNETRLAAGAGCMNMVTELNASSQNHCDYQAANRGNPSCTPGGHDEVQGCIGFTGETMTARMIAAGYSRQLAYTEVYYSFGNPTLAVPGWIATVWHRIPLIDPWTKDMGYGGGPGCDTIDMGRGTGQPPDDTIVVYPYDGQTDVLPSWSGREAPAAPAPPSGFPSSYPINIYAKNIAVTEHVMTKDGDPTPLEHRFIDKNSPDIGWLRSYMSNTVFMYGAPFAPNTTYRANIVGTYAGGALNVEWTFTTASGGGFRYFRVP